MRFILQRGLWGRYNVYAVSCVMVMLLSQTVLHAEELALFRMTGVDGELSLRQIQNEVVQESESGSRNRSRLKTNEESLSFLTHSYVYHPKFLEMDLGAGVNFIQSEYDTGSGTTESEGEVYGLSARMSFLKDKPYPFILYYDKLNPSTQVSGAESFSSENEKYGFNASLLEPVIPFSVNLQAFRDSTKGEGATQIVNQSNQQVVLRAYKSLEQNKGHIQFTYHNRQQVSESGVRDVPVQKTEKESQATSLDSDTIFGANDQFRLINVFSYFDQDRLPREIEARWAPNLTWRHTEGIESYYSFDFSDREIDSIKSEHRSGNMGVNIDASKHLTISAGVRSSNDKTQGLEVQSEGASTSFDYTYPFDNGNLQLVYANSYDNTENKANESVARRQNEGLRYNGVGHLQLAYPYVVDVINVALERDGVIIYSSLVNGEDYTVDTSDPVLTFINIIINPNPDLQKVVPGDLLLVDYTYQTGGDVRYTSINNSLSANLLLFRYYSIYASYSDTEQELEQGKSTIPLNSSEHTRYGVKMDHPFDDDKYRLGLEVIRERQDEEVAPYTRDTADSFFQVAFTNYTSLRLSLRRVQQDNERSTTQDSDVLSRSVAISTAPWSRATLRMEHRNDVDTGGNEKQSITRNSLQFRMQIRKLSFTVDGSSVEEQYGGLSRHYNSFMAHLVRTF